MLVPSEQASGTTKRSPRYRRVDHDPFQITERDLDFMEAVGRHGVLESVHLDLLFPTASPQHLRRRLKFLFHAGYLARPRAQIVSMLDRRGSRSMVYTLTQSGARLLLARRGIALDPKSGDLKLMQLEHAIEISDFMVAVEAACGRSQFLEPEPFREILLRSPEATRAASMPDKWKVRITYQGSPQSFHLRPDKIFAIRHRGATPDRDPHPRKFFFLEADRATMPVVRPKLYQTSILRKYFTYAESFRAGIHRDRFAMNNMRVLFVAKNRLRVETMIDAFQDHMSGKASPRLFLFADRETLFANGTAFFDHRWLDGEGKEHTLFE